MFLQRETKTTKPAKHTCFIYREPDYIVKACPKYKAMLVLLELLVDEVIKVEEENNNT